MRLPWDWNEMECSIRSVKRYNMKPSLFLLAACAYCAAPARADVDPAAARLFERAATIYGDAQSVTLDYRVTSNSRDLPAAESGRIWWSRPKMFAQSWTYAAGSGHVAADEKQIYFTDVDGKAGCQNWKGEFGFWTSLPYRLPGNLEFLLRGQKIPLGNASLRSLKSQKLDGVWCDGALLDLRRVNGDTIRFWFARKTGLLMRESWAVALPESNEIAQVQTRYFNIRLNPKLERGDFVRPTEENAPLLEQPPSIHDGDTDNSGAPKQRDGQTEKLQTDRN